VLSDPGIDIVCQERVRGPTTAAAPAVPAVPAHSASAVACYNRLPNPRTPGGAVVPAIAAVPANGNWRANPFPAAGAVREIPVALCELAFHDQQEDARLLSRAWFRRLAAEAMAMGIQDQLRATPANPAIAPGPANPPAAVTFADIRAVLRRVFGNTPALSGLADPGAITAAAIGNALRTVANPGATDPAGTSLDALTGAALAAAGALTRQQLIDLIRDELRVVAGWEAADQQATVDTWVRGPITYGAALSRPNAVPTRAEAGALACSAIGLAAAGLATAQTVPVGEPAQPLLGFTPGGASAYFTRAEAALLTARLRTLRPGDVYRMADTWFASATWTRLDSQPGVYELDPGTPIVVVVRTAGAAWKTVNQTGADALQDIEIHLESGIASRKLACAARTNLQAVSSTWLLDLPASGRQVDVNVELWARHRTEGRQRVGVKTLHVTVRAPAV